MSENGFVVDAETAELLRTLAALPEDAQVLAKAASIDPIDFRVFMDVMNLSDVREARDLLEAAREMKEMMRHRPRGKVKWFSDPKGYGFITPDGATGDLFVHHSEIQGTGFKTLSENDVVEFEIGQGRTGPCATKVKKID